MAQKISGMNQIQSFPVAGSTRAFYIDPKYLRINWDPSKRDDVKDVLYPRSTTTNIMPGQAILAQFNPTLGRYGFWPTPHGLPCSRHDATIKEKRELQRRAIGTHNFRVLGVAGTEQSSFDKDKLFSVVVHSPLTKFVNTGGDLIRDGYEVCVRLPTESECKTQMARWGSYCFATEGRDRYDVTRRVDDFIDFLRIGNLVSPDFHDSNEARKSFVKTFGTIADLIRQDVVSEADEHGTIREWLKGDSNSFVNFNELFTGENHRGTLKRLLYEIFKVTDCIRSDNDLLILGEAVGDVPPFTEGRIKLRA